MTDATYDYIAARTLFLSYLPQQASILSSTAIEKLFKALMVFNGDECHGHLKKAHWNGVRKLDKKTFSQLNTDFLVLNQKVYRMRYSHDLPIGFNIVIASREFLAELDYTFLTLINNISFEHPGELKVRKSLLSMTNDKDTRLFAENHILQGMDKISYIYEKPQFVYEFRKYADKIPLQMEYYSEKQPKKDSFLREAAIIGKHNSQEINVEMAFYPLPGTLVMQL